MRISCRGYRPTDYYLFLAGVFNDIAVASAICLKDYPSVCNLQSPILVVDLDVHQVVAERKVMCSNLVMDDSLGFFLKVAKLTSFDLII